ncbi:uncharacterized protein LOC133795182 [Humulus lupulus]|uniref:uncharacterized protein LOC133795182 n=1 Tax=Humulus lupulus TaxID=3486 RepID=UPI002B408D0E|nr:uncharacterized protein LOC133795182 [Humulus lupulus]
MTKVAILGAGNLAWTLAGDLLLRPKSNYEVTVWTPLDHRSAFDVVAAGGPLQLTGVATGQFFPALETDLGVAIKSADFIIVTVPTLGQVDILNALAEHDLSTSTVIALPGGGFTLLAKRLLRQEQFPKFILETSTSPYACRKSGNTVSILGLKRQIEIATSKKLHTTTKAAIAALFPQRLEWYQDLASIFFSNVNPVAHPAGILRAREAIESGVRPLPLFYKECIPAAIGVVLAVDEERLAIVKALGLQSNTDIGYSKAWYGTDAPDSKTFFETYEGYATIEAPSSINHRYIKEDVKYIMVLWVQIAVVCGVKVPVMEYIIDQASNAVNEDLRHTGRSLASLGLEGADKDAILRALNGMDSLTLT